MICFSQVIRDIGDRARQLGQGRSGSGTTDSLRHRDKNEDSISITFRYLDSARVFILDSSVNDFSRRFPVPASHIFLGNTGNAARPILFTPMMTAGFDPGFHAYDIYKWKPERVRFFNTTRPYSEINYMLGTRVEQIIELMHTQNLNSGWNVSFNYRLINTPGFFQNQNTNHNNYLVNSWYQTRNRRYNNYFIFLRNKLASAENGGIQDTADFLENPIYRDRANIPTKLGGTNPFSTNFFVSKITSGTFSNEVTLLLRQQYDLGRKDSLVTDSTVIPLFYPRLRFEHTLTYNSRKYEFRDLKADSAYYEDHYDTTIAASQDSFILKESWKEIINDFSIYQFPDAKNQQQFIRLGVFIQNISGMLTRGKSVFYNIAGHAEYRNKTKNQLWDIEANGTLYFAGLNAADYQMHISLQRLIGKKLGYIQLGFENTSRTPSFVYDSRSSFYLMDNPVNFKKENTTHLFASYFLPSFKIRLTGHYYLLTNYTYTKNYYQLEQENALFNFLQIILQKTFKIGKRWLWHADLYFQQAIGNAPVNAPIIYSRNRIGYEGNLGFKNLDIAFGLEVKYRPRYKADDYSPVLARFFFQDRIEVKNKLPDVSAYVHFRIRPFKAFIRAENLNTARNLGGFGFTNNNLVAPGYAMPGLQIRVGIYWGFVN